MKRTPVRSSVLLGLFALVPAAQAQVSGVILDDMQSPVPGALVTLQATAISTTSALDGTFDLPGAVGANLTIVGAKKGYYNESVLVSSPATAVEIQLELVPPDDDSTYAFIEPATCGVCHPDQLAEWTGSPMSLAGDNTWVYDIYDGTGTAGGMGGFVYTRDSAHAGSNPESECASCHQPEPWIDEPFSALEDIQNLSEGALHGISCEVCHKIADIDESKKNFPGIYPGTVEFTRPDSGSTQVQYGVLGDTDYVNPVIMRSSYQPQLVAAVCCACHQDKNDPDGDGDFEEANGVISEPTYLEWLDSPYGDPQSPSFATCVDCHMPATNATQACSVGGPIRGPGEIRSHRIEGTTAPFLENAVDLLLNAQVSSDSVLVQVVVDNQHTGHHVPTGVTVRNMILLVEAWREEDGLSLTHTGAQTVHDLGGVGDPAQGYYAGLPGKFFAKVNHDSSGQGPTFFTDATGIQFDSRIPALQSDATSYTFQVPPGGGTLHVRARLIYRRAFRFLVDAKGWTEDGHGNPLEDVQPPYWGHLMEEQEWVGIVTGVESFGAPTGIVLEQSSPNPASPRTTIRFRLPAASHSHLAIYDLQGRLVRVLADGVRGAGVHAVPWDGLDSGGAPASSGVYLYRLTTGQGPPVSRRLVLLR